MEGLEAARVMWYGCNGHQKPNTDPSQKHESHGWFDTPFRAGMDALLLATLLPQAQLGPKYLPLGPREFMKNIEKQTLCLLISWSSNHNHLRKHIKRTKACLFDQRFLKF